MTTLPQTAPLRLQRPASASTALVAAPAHAPLAIPPSQPGVVPTMTGADVWRVIRANLWLIVLLVGVAGVAGYFINGYLAKNQPVYTATGLIRILPPPSTDPLHSGFGGGMDATTLENEQNTESALLTSDGLIHSVLDDPSSPIRSSRWWLVTCQGDPQRARQLLASNFRAGAPPQANTQLIQVSMSAPTPADTVTIVQAMVSKAIEDNRQFISRKNEAERNRVQELLDARQADRRSAQKDVEDLSIELNNSGIGTEGHVSTREIELAAREDAMLKARSDAQLADGQYASFMSALQAGQTPPRVDEQVEQDPSVVEYRHQLDTVQAQLNVTAGQYGTDNPQAQTLQRECDEYQRQLDNAKAAARAQLVDASKSELQTLRDSSHKSLESLTQQVDDLKTAMGQLASKQSLYSRRRDDEQRAAQEVAQYERIIADMSQMERVASFSSLDWAQLPQLPDSPSFPRLYLTMAGAIGIGLALSLGIAFLREVTDTTVRSPRDIQRVGHLQLLGMVPHEADDPQSAGARLPLVIFEAPTSVMAEQLRQIRTRLQHSASLDTTRSILITSPSPGDGKSTIACNLAAGLALNGRQILLIDANFRRPELHRIFGVGNEVGFSDVLNDVNQFETAVRTTSVPNLSFLPSGPRPSNPTELLESQLLIDVIDRALEEYDHVIFDSGPMLFVSDTMALAPRVDGVVTVVKARANTRGLLMRMRDGLRAVKAEHLGVVLNAVRSQAGGYYGRTIKTYYAYQSQE